MYIMDLLFSSPRLRFSDAQKRAVITWAKALGAPNVPTLYGLKKCHDRICNQVGNPTEKVKANSGNIFYLNSIAKAIAKDYANPLTRMCMQDYPEDGQGSMSQAHHGEKMLNLPDGLAVPSVRVSKKIYFTGELLQQSSQSYFIPKRFFQAYLPDGDAAHPEPAILAIGNPVALTAAGFIVDPERIIVEVSTFARTFEEIEEREFECGFTESSRSYAQHMPNPLRKKSGGRLVLSVPLIIFIDDVSGNVSKQWNKHHVVYMSNAAMPRQMLEKEFCIRFVSSSPHASPLKLAKGVKDSITTAAEQGVIAWDCKYKEEIMLVPYGLFKAGDNPMQAEECSHGGLKCNMFCRTCYVGGTMVEKSTDEGYLKIFESGRLREPDDTRKHIYDQIALSKLSGGTEKVKNAVTSSGIRDAASASIVNHLLVLGKSLRKREAGKPALKEDEVRATLEKEFEDLLCGRPLEEFINPLLGMPGVNIHRDTPTEILHTVLLGVVKYFWGQTVFILEKAHLLDTFQTRLESISTNGLHAPTLGTEYICHYKGSLIGKHFKSLAQVMPYIIYDLVLKTVLNGWTVIGEVVVLLWHTKIDDLETYLAQLSCTIEDFLTVSAQCAPSILISKAKFHFLLHIPMYIRQFGPAILFSTERFESFNHVFRLTCIHSNRQAPSRDSCNTFASHDTIKHVVTGGFWFDAVQKKWVRAGDAVRQYIADHPEQRHLLGLNTANAKAAGFQTRSHRICADPQNASKHPSSSSSRFVIADSIVATNGDTVAVGGHIILSDEAETLRIRKIIEILAPDNNRMYASHVAIQFLQFLPTVHPTLWVPRMQTITNQEVKSPEQILCAVNIQHDCASSQCVETRSICAHQEREQTTRTKRIVKHKETNSFLLNV
ncbi:hypothetical protein BDR04DRAFT_1038375, partial [Suillus decipiens]